MSICICIYEIPSSKERPRFHSTCKLRYAYGTLLRCNRLADLIKSRLRLLSWCAWHHCGLRRRNLGTGGNLLGTTIQYPIQSCTWTCQFYIDLPYLLLAIQFLFAVLSFFPLLFVTSRLKKQQVEDTRIRYWCIYMNTLTPHSNQIR